MTRSTLAILACTLIAPLAAPLLAQSRHDWDAAHHPQEVLARFPTVRQAWHAVVPRAYRRQPWVYALAGTASDIDYAYVGRPSAMGTVCKPHDCGGHVVAYLIALDGSRAVGAMMLPRGAGGRRHERWFGAPTAEERASLSVELYHGR